MEKRDKPYGYSNGKKVFYYVARKDGAYWVLKEDMYNELEPRPAIKKSFNSAEEAQVCLDDFAKQNHLLPNFTEGWDG